MDGVGQPAAPIPIVALDAAAGEGALALVARLGGQCNFYKVGSELFTAAGPDIVRRLRDLGHEVFLDLKFHDIPNTVRAAVRSAAALGVRLITVHASGGASMISAAVEGAGEESRVLAVTVLTSLDSARLGAAWGRTAPVVAAEVSRLAEVAAVAGAHGVVCSGEEAGLLRDRYGERLARLVPGIRLAGGASHDQVRVVTPSAAARAGATYLILGRAVTGVADPAEAMRAVRAELATALAAPGTRRV